MELIYSKICSTDFYSNISSNGPGMEWCVLFWTTQGEYIKLLFLAMALCSIIVLGHAELQHLKWSKRHVGQNYGTFNKDNFYEGGSCFYAWHGVWVCQGAFPPGLNGKKYFFEKSSVRFQWCTNPKNSVILTSRSSPGTLARQLIAHQGDRDR